jgi:nucleotide-binding universal stress UspA family protein
MEYVYDEEKEPAECIARFVREHEIGLLVIGSKGRTAAASIVMGSIAKNLTQILHDVPLMVVKERNKSMDLLDALKEV